MDRRAVLRLEHIVVEFGVDGGSSAFPIEDRRLTAIINAYNA
jgi:hypothetical protein